MAPALSPVCCTNKRKATMHALQSSKAGRGLHARASQRAMTLIEVIGVLAIIAVLASVVLPALIRQTDNVVAAQESATLQSFGNAFQSSITRNRRIPGVTANDWV